VSHALNLSSIQEMVVVLDFHTIGGIAPALKTPHPEFKIGVTKKYLEGEFPDWFLTQKVKQSFLQGFQDLYQRLAHNEIMTIYRTPEQATCYTITSIG